MEATNTDLIVRLVEAGLDVSIVPPHSSGAVTRGRSVDVRSLRRLVRAVESGTPTRKGDGLSATADKNIVFCRGQNGGCPT